MDIIHVAHDLAGSMGKFFECQMLKIICFDQTFVNVGQADPDVLPKLELVVAFFNLDGAKVACLIIDVLK